MLYRTMPGSGDRLSILGFGCMRLPMIDGKIDEERAIRQIRYAIDNGVNYLDTAWPYHGGHSEPLVGKAIKDGYREKVKIATKLPTWLVDSREDMDRFLDAQLEKLGVDRIDYYLVHSLNKLAWEKAERLGVTEFLDQAVSDGRIVNPGFSYHGMGKDFAPIVDAYPWTFCQIQYNLMDIDYQAGEAGLEYAASKGLGVIIMEPLRGGYLGGAAPEAVQAIWDESDIKRSQVEWALRFIWNRPEATIIISGMNEEEHIDQNLQIASNAIAGVLSDSELETVKRAGDKYKELIKVNCTGCAYCLPCPAEVNIPTCFDAYNKTAFENEQRGLFAYVIANSVMTAGKTGFASQCVECGECVEKCPQNIPIPDILKEVAGLFEKENFDEVAKNIRGMMSNI